MLQIDSPIIIHVWVMLFRWFLQISSKNLSGSSMHILFLDVVKVLVFTYCALNAIAPNYLVQLINYRNVTRTLRSSSSTELLFVPKSRTMMNGDRCIEVASPILWNNLPVSLRTAKCLTQFRSQLKTNLFKAAFT